MPPTPVCNESDDTPIKSNKKLLTDNFVTSLISNSDASEDGSIYTTLTNKSSIYSNISARSQIRAASMAIKVRSTKTLEKKIPDPNELVKSRGGWHATPHDQQINESVTLQDWLKPKRNKMGTNFSPVSLPSILGTTCVNDVSDLESPNIIAPVLNFEFSDEESTIQSQSIQEESEINSSTGSDNHLPIGSPRSLMTETATPKHTAAHLKKDLQMYHREGNDSPIPRPTPSTVSASNPSSMHSATYSRSASPRSVITEHSFRDGYDAVFKCPSYLRRCVIMGLLAAILGTVTVIAIILADRSDEMYVGKMATNATEDWFDMNNAIDSLTVMPIPTPIATPTTVPSVKDNEILEIGNELNTMETLLNQIATNVLWSTPTSTPTADPTIVLSDKSDEMIENLKIPTAIEVRLNSNTAFGTPSLTLSPTIILSETDENGKSRPTEEYISNATNALNETNITHIPTSYLARPVLDSSSSIDQTNQTAMPTLMETFHPTILTSIETTVHYTYKLSSTATVLNHIPDAPRENNQKLNWNYLIGGEEIWQRVGKNSLQTPLWYFVNDNAGIQLEVANAVRKNNRFIAQLNTVVKDYSYSDAISTLKINAVPYEVLCPPPDEGVVKICAGDFGVRDWVGSTIFFTRGEFVVAAIIRIDENLFSVVDESVSQYILCHQFGHALGLHHSSTGGLQGNNTGSNYQSCMRDFNQSSFDDLDTIPITAKLQHPDKNDLDTLADYYGTAN